MNYREEKKISEKYKKEYADGLRAVIDRRNSELAEIRAEYAKNILKDREKFCEDFKKMLGWPLVGHTPEADITCTSEKLAQEDGYSVYRMSFEVLQGVMMTGLLFKDESRDCERKPLVIAQHGGKGSPELISGAYGDTANYNDMLHRVRKYGVHVFAPQLLLWDEEEYGVNYNRAETDAALRRTGSSVTAVEVYGIKRILDYFEKEDYTSSFGMVGLSYGGFYTLYTAATDTRIKAAISCSFFNKREAVDWSDWAWWKSGEMFDDAETACLIYPRKLWIRVGDEDQLFESKNAVESFEKLKKLCADSGDEWVDFKVFGGKHEFYAEEDVIESFINELK